MKSTSKAALCALILLALTSSVMKCQVMAQQKVRVVVTDPTTAPIAKVLVVVGSLDDYTEVYRALTDENGRVEATLRDGDYQVVATYPFTLFKDSITELRVKNSDKDVTLVLPTWHDQYVYDTLPCEFRVLLNGKPVANAKVLRRQQRSTEGQRQYMTDNDGRTTMRLLSDPFVVVVFHGDDVYYFDGPQKCPKNGVALDVGLSKR